MTPTEISLLADYNAWMNAKLYAAAASLPAHELTLDHKAFFGSIIGTLNHLVVADTIWLKRFTTHPAQFVSLAPIAGLPAPTALDDILFGDIAALEMRRKLLDDVITQWAAELTAEHLQCVFHYRSMKGGPGQKRFSSVLMHFFNHQTHHRGQATTLLFQAGVDVGITDLLARIPNEI